MNGDSSVHAEYDAVSEKAQKIKEESDSLLKSCPPNTVDPDLVPPRETSEEAVKIPNFEEADNWVEGGKSLKEYKAELLSEGKNW